MAVSLLKRQLARLWQWSLRQFLFLWTSTTSTLLVWVRKHQPNILISHQWKRTSSEEQRCKHWHRTENVAVFLAPPHLQELSKTTTYFNNSGQRSSPHLPRFNSSVPHFIDLLGVCNSIFHALPKPQFLRDFLHGFYDDHQRWLWRLHS